jgi:hypothetical protein
VPETSHHLTLTSPNGSYHFSIANCAICGLYELLPGIDGGFTGAGNCNSTAAHPVIKYQYLTRVDVCLKRGLVRFCEGK